MNSSDFVEPNGLSPISLAVWTADAMLLKTNSYTQSLMYARNLLPDQLESIYKTRLHELRATTAIRNISMLYDTSDEAANVHFASYNAQHFLNASVKRVLKFLDYQNIDISINCADTCKSVMFDMRRISIILFNLISNVITHNKRAKKKITISAFIRGDDFVVSIRDNGRGIDKQKQETLFTPFSKRIDLKTVRETGGLILTGLGLAVSRKVARDMHGDLIYVPTPKDTEFELTIPQNHFHRALGETRFDEADPDDVEAYLASALLYLKYGE